MARVAGASNFFKCLNSDMLVSSVFCHQDAYNASKQEQQFSSPARVTVAAFAWLPIVFLIYSFTSHVIIRHNSLCPQVCWCLVDISKPPQMIVGSSLTHQLQLCINNNCSSRDKLYHRSVLSTGNVDLPSVVSPLQMSPGLTI